MTPPLGVLEFGDYAIIAGIVVVFAGAAAYTTRQRIDLGRLERQLSWLQQKMDALLKHQGVELPPPPPSSLSQEVERLASDPSTKIQAIKLYREQNPGVGLAEAKTKIEAFFERRQ
jgi:hypothetical protein